MDDFEKELKAGFLDEAEAAATEVEQCFLVLESDPNDTPTIDKIFRLAHNLKGSSKAVGFDDMGAFTHQFESLLLKLKNKELPVLPATVNLLLRCNDYLSQLIQALKTDFDAKIDATDLLNEIEQAKSGEGLSVVETVSVTPEIPAVPPADLFPEEEVIDGQELVFNPLGEESTDALAVEPEVAPQVAPVEPIVSAPAVSAPPIQPVLEAVAKKTPQAAPEESIRISVSKVEKLLNYVGEMVILESVLREQAALSGNLLMRKTIHQLGKVGKEIQDISMSLKMVPVKPTFQKMQRIVRDTAQALNKEIQLTLIGEETELDKTVLEKINDPLVHLIRNSVDHGIESQDRRVAAGKNPVGKVTLSAAHEAGKLVIQVKDDGGGIDGERLKKKAIEKGIIKPNAQLSEKEALNLIFAAGFSTKEQVTDVSGRGVGMDVVRTNIEDLSGEIHLETKLGEGTTFKIYLPLTLAIIDGMTVLVGEEKFVLPLAHVHESLQPNPADIRSTGAGDLLLLRGENLPLYRMSNLMGRKSNKKPEEQIAIVVRTGNQPFALLVDDIIGQYQVVIKQLSSELQHLKGFVGSTILGDGKPSFIIEPNELILKNTSKPHSPMKGAAA